MVRDRIGSRQYPDFSDEDGLSLGDSNEGDGNGDGSGTPREGWGMGHWYGVHRHEGNGIGREYNRNFE